MLAAEVKQDSRRIGGHIVRSMFVVGVNVTWRRSLLQLESSAREKGRWLQSFICVISSLSRSFRIFLTGYLNTQST